MSDEVSVPCWRGEPITPGWWWLEFNDRPGPRFWDGVFWNRGSYFAGAEDYAEFPILGPCVLPEMYERYTQALNEIIELTPEPERDNVLSAKIAISALNGQPDMSGFVDPSDDDNPIIGGTGRIYYRISSDGHKLSELLRIEPSLRDVAVSARNHAGGCWVALNSQVVARRIVSTLNNHGMGAALELVDADGQPAPDLTEADYDTIIKAITKQA